MNTASVISIIRHWITAAAGMAGVWLIATLALTGEEGTQLTEALAKLAEPLIAIGGLIVVALSRLLITWIGSLFGRGAGGMGDKLNGIPVWLALNGTAAAVVGSLPSCSMSEYPISGSLSYRDDATGAKAGITFYPPVRKVRATK